MILIKRELSSTYCDSTTLSCSTFFEAVHICLPAHVINSAKNHVMCAYLPGTRTLQD